MQKAGKETKKGIANRFSKVWDKVDKKAEVNPEEKPAKESKNTFGGGNNG